MLFFVLGTEAGTFAHGDTITGNSSGATATVNNAAANGGPTSTTPGATRVLVLNMGGTGSEPFAPPPFPCRPTGPMRPPPGGPPTLPYTLEQTTINRYTRLPVTIPAPAAALAFYSTSNLDTDGIDTVPAIPPGSGAQIVSLTYFDSTGAGPFTTFTKMMGKFPSVVSLVSGSIDVAQITACSVFQVGAFENSVGQITLAALPAFSVLPSIPADATPEDFPGLTDAAQLLLERPLIYLPPSYFALAQQGTSDPQLAGDFIVKQGSPTVLTTVNQGGVVADGNTIEFAAQPGVQYTIESVSAAFVTLTTPYTGLSAAEIAPAAEAPHPARSVTERADGVVSAAKLISPSLATPPDGAQLTTLLAEFTLPQSTVPAITYTTLAGGPFEPGETVIGQKSGGTGIVLYEAAGTDADGTLAFTAVQSGFMKGETVTGTTSGATATVVVRRTFAPSTLPTKLSGLYARTLQLVLGAPIVSQPITVV